MVDLTARIEPVRADAGRAAQRSSPPPHWLRWPSNVDDRQGATGVRRPATSARPAHWSARPAGQQSGLVDAIRAAESALGQARTLLDAVDSAAHRHQPRGGRAAFGDRRHPERHRPGRQHNCSRATAPHADRARGRPRRGGRGASTTRRRNGSADPLGAFTQLTKADADLDRLLASVAEEREAAERLSRAFDQALFTAQSRVRAVSDFIDTRRGSIGPEARTRLAEAVRQLQAAQAKKATNLTEAIAHANGASMLAAQAQSLANDDVQRGAADVHAALRRRTAVAATTWARCIGGIIIGNILRRRQFGGGVGGGVGRRLRRWAQLGRPTSYGGRRGRRAAATAAAAAASSRLRRPR